MDEDVGPSNSGQLGAAHVDAVELEVPDAAQRIAHIEADQPRHPLLLGQSREQPLPHEPGRAGDGNRNHVHRLAASRTGLNLATPKSPANPEARRAGAAPSSGLPGMPFGGGGFDLAQLMQMLQSQGPINWDVARQIAAWVAVEGGTERSIDPAAHSSSTSWRAPPKRTWSARPT